MNTSKFILTVAWLALSLLIIIGLNQAGLLTYPQRAPMDQYGNTIGRRSPEMQTILDLSGLPDPSIRNREGSLIARWTFDENKGTVMHDLIGNGFDGNGPANWLQDKDCVSGSCLELRSKDQRGVSLRLPALPAYTFSGWVKHRVAPNGEFQIMNAVGDSAGLTIFDGRALFYDGLPLIGKTILQKDVYYHIAVTYEGAYKHLYINGVEDAAASGYSSMAAGPAMFGANTSGQMRFFDGVIDEFTLYDRALSPSEIMDLYDMNKGGAKEASDPAMLQLIETQKL